MEPDRQDKSIDSHNIFCPTCTYCLYGLPSRNRCPECGIEYVADGPDIARAVEIFTETLPGRWRLWLKPKPPLSRFPWPALVALLMTCAVSSVIFVCACGLTTMLASVYPSQLFPRDTIHTLFGTIYGSGPRFSLVSSGAIVSAVWICIGELLLAAMIRWWYSIRAWRLPVHHRVMGRLGLFAALSVPWLLALPMAILVTWQYFNVRFPVGMWGSLWPRNRIYLPYLGFDRTWLTLIVILILIVVACTFGLRAYRRHRRCF